MNTRVPVSPDQAAEALRGYATFQQSLHPAGTRDHVAAGHALTVLDRLAQVEAELAALRDRR